MFRSFAFGAVCLALAGCLGSDCVNDVRQELASPDGKMKIVLFSRNCGATTGLNTQASVLDAARELPNTPGNLFVSDKGSAKVSWKKDGGILVVLDRGVRIFKKETRVSGVAIEYHEE